MITRISALLVTCLFLSFSTWAQKPEEAQKRLGKDLYEKVKGQLSFFPYDSSFRVKALYDPSITKNEPQQFPTSEGSSTYFMEFGTLRFTLKEKSYQLKLYRPWPIQLINRYQIFLPFRDESAKQETYPAGRYLPLTMDDFQEDGIWLDFNQAVNPLCAYDSSYACPLPPQDNHLKVKILAGEKRPISTP